MTDRDLREENRRLRELLARFAAYAPAARRMSMPRSFPVLRPSVDVVIYAEDFLAAEDALAGRLPAGDES